MQHLLRLRNPGRVKARAASQSATGKQAGMSRKIAVVILNPLRAIRFTQVLTRTVSSNAKQSLRVMCMTASSAIHSCWGMKPPFMRMRLTVRKRRATSCNVLALQIRCNVRATATNRSRSKTAGATMQSPLSVLALNAPLPRIKVAKA